MSHASQLSGSEVKRQLMLLWMAIPILLLGPVMVMLVPLGAGVLAALVLKSSEGAWSLEVKVITVVTALGWVMLSVVTCMSVNWMRLVNRYVQTGKRFHGRGTFETMKLVMVCVLVMSLLTLLNTLGKAGLFGSALAPVTMVLTFLSMPALIVALIAGMMAHVHLSHLFQALRQRYELKTKFQGPILSAGLVFIGLIILLSWFFSWYEVEDTYQYVVIPQMILMSTVSVFHLVQNVNLMKMLVLAWMHFDSHADDYMQSVDQQKQVRLKT